MRMWLARILVIAILMVAAIFGALNSRIVELDFLFATWNLPLGVGLMAFFVAGSALGALVAYLAMVPKLKREIGKLRKSTPPG